MAAYFDIIIHLEKLFKSIVNLNLDKEVDFYVEYWNQKSKTHFKKINPHNIEIEDFNQPSYKGFFMISKTANYNIDQSPFDDEVFQYVVEVKGGKEDKDNIELISFRRVAKESDKSIDKVFQKIQRTFKKNMEFDKGVKWGNHFYKNIYFDKSVSKRIWKNLEEKDFEIKINTTHNKASNGK